MTTNMTNLTAAAELCSEEYIPHHDTSMKIEILYQVFCFVIGTVVNVYALWRHIALLKASNSHEGRLIQLSLHLIIANLIVLWVYCMIKTVWLYTYVWNWGNLLCKLYSFLSTLGFHLWSNMVMAIALDMFFCIVFPFQAYLNGMRRVRVLVCLAWGVAFCVSIPQIFVRGTVPMPCTADSYQCYFLYYNNVTVKRFYLIYHALAVFYIPLSVIIVCYCVIAQSVVRSLKARESLISEEPRKQPLVLAKRQEVDSEISIGSPRKTKPLESPLINRRLVSRTSELHRIQATKARLLRISIAIISVYLFSWLPYQIFGAWRLACGDDEACGISVSRFEWLEVFMLLSACINPFLYRFKPSTSSQPSSHSLPPPATRNHQRGESNETAAGRLESA